MLIDWFTVIAQLINFLILIYLLKRFLYKPILNAIDARELRIANELDDAKKKQEQADVEKQQYQDLNDQLLKSKATLLTQAQTEANQAKEQMLNEARDAYQKLQDQYQLALMNEHKQLTGTLRRKVETEILETIRKTLADLADQSLESQMTTVFSTKLRQLNDSDRATLRTALQSKGHDLSIQSSYPVPSKEQQGLSEILVNMAGKNVPVLFETVPDALPGIILKVGGFKLSWSVENYLQALHELLDHIVEAPENTPVTHKTINAVIDVGQKN